MQPDSPHAPSTPPDRLNAILRELATILEPAERHFLGEPRVPPHPVVYVIGNSRAGSTLMMRWLADSGLFCYPSNLISRFYASPYIGARIQQLLTEADLQVGSELVDGPSRFASDIGKTNGSLAPHEFWYFWRRFVPSHHLAWMPPEAEAQVDEVGLRSGLAALQLAFDKPLALKGKFFNFNLRKLHGIFPRCVFLYVHRDPLMNCQSLLLARRQRYGNDADWFGVRPPQYPALAALDPYAQVAGQVFNTDREIAAQLVQFDRSHVLDVRYEDFCADPRSHFDALVDRLAALGYDCKAAYHGPLGFDASTEVRLPREEFDRLQTAWSRL